MKLIIYKDEFGVISDVFVDDRETGQVKMMLEQEGCKILAVEEHKGKSEHTEILSHDRETEFIIVQAIKFLRGSGRWR